MKVVLRDPPLLLLVAAILFDLTVARGPRADNAPRRSGWAARQIDRLIEWRKTVSRRA